MMIFAYFRSNLDHIYHFLTPLFKNKRIENSLLIFQNDRLTILTLFTYAGKIMDWDGDLLL